MLFTDVALLDGSGVTLAAELPTIPTVFTSGRPDERALRDINSDRFLPKPYSPEELIAEIQRVVSD